MFHDEDMASVGGRCPESHEGLSNQILFDVVGIDLNVRECGARHPRPSRVPLRVASADAQGGMAVIAYSRAARVNVEPLDELLDSSARRFESDSGETRYQSDQCRLRAEIRRMEAEQSRDSCAQHRAGSDPNIGSKDNPRTVDAIGRDLRHLNIFV